MRAVWVDNGNDPAYAKLAARGITVPFFDPRDPRVTSLYLSNVRAQPGITACGIYTAWNWEAAFADPRVYAEWTDAQLKRIGWPGNAYVCLNIEKGDNGVTDATFANYVVACLQRWRQLRPKRETWWSPPGNQGGLFNAASVMAIAATEVVTAPQFYDGSMNPLPHSPIIDLLMAGFQGAYLDGMYDAAALPYRWRGFAFTQGRLP